MKPSTQSPSRKRRRLLQFAAGLSLLSGVWKPMLTRARAAVGSGALARVRPGNPGWPSETQWDELGQQVGDALVKVQSPLATCVNAPDSADCQQLFKELKNPYFLGDEVGLTQSLGWVDAWTSSPSIYAVAARNTNDVVAAINFARRNNLRLVVKGGGNSYQGTSNAPDSLLVWTRKMNGITVRDAFVGTGCEGHASPVRAVTVGAGALWAHVYDAVTTQAGGYIQGGGCMTVGVAGLIQSGGFGSFSKAYGLAAGSLLEAEVVTADGAVRIANACTNPDLFWGLKGGGGGSFGVVTRLTLRTHELPKFLGGGRVKIKANSDAAFAQLISRFIEFYRDALFNPHWGEQVKFGRDNILDISMACHGLDDDQALAVWQPFFDWVTASPGDFT